MDADGPGAGASNIAGAKACINCKLVFSILGVMHCIYQGMARIEMNNEHASRETSQADLLAFIDEILRLGKNVCVHTILYSACVQDFLN